MSQLVSSRLFAAAVLATTLAMPAGALAQTRTSDEQNAVIDSYTDTPEGCVIVSLMISQVKQDPPGHQVAMSTLAIYRAWFNLDCATFIAQGSGPMDSIAAGNTLENPTEFTLDQRLMTGTVKTTMSIYFYATGEERPVTIDLVLSGIEGTLSPVRLRDLYPGSTSGWVLGHTRGYYRDTTASGSVFDGVTNYFGNPYAVKGFLRVWHTQISGPSPRLLH